MANLFNPVAKTFSLRLVNKYEEAKYLALFAGTIQTMGLAKDSEGNPHLVFSDPRPVRNYSQASIDCVMTDGVSPIVEGDDLVIPDKKSGKDYFECIPSNPQFKIEDLKNYLKNNYYLISRIIIKVQSQDQFDNPITLQTSSPTQNNGSKTILPTNYSDPTMLQTTKIIIDDIKGTVFQDDTMMYWKINGGEVINITFEFDEAQKS